MSFDFSLENNEFELSASQSQFASVSSKAKKLCDELLSDISDIKTIVEDSEVYWKTESAYNEREKFQLEVLQLDSPQNLLADYAKKLEAIVSKFMGETKPEEFVLPEDFLS